MKRIGFVILALFSYLVATATMASAQTYPGETMQGLRYLATYNSPTAPPMQVFTLDDLYVTVFWVGITLNDLGGVLDNPGGNPLTRESGECPASNRTCIARFRITENSKVTVRPTLLINNTGASFFVYSKECVGTLLTTNRR
jgi:hypothetical protein